MSGRSARTVPRPRTAADRSAGGDGIQRHPRRSSLGCSELSDDFADRIGELETEIYELAGARVQHRLAKQLRQVLFEELKLPVLKQNEDRPQHRRRSARRTGPAAPAAGQDHRVSPVSRSSRAPMSMRCRSLSIRTTGRVHASFKQVVAATGRLSSQRSELAEHSDPHAKRGARFARRFCPARRAGNCWRPTIRKSNCACWPIFRATKRCSPRLRDDEDIHTRVASQVYGVPLDEVTREHAPQRQGDQLRRHLRPKPVRAGQVARHRQDEAAKFIDAYFANGIPASISSCSKRLRDCRKQGYVSTISGRRRPVEGVRDIDLQARQAATQLARAHRDQHRHSRLRRRHHQAGDDPVLPPTRCAKTCKPRCCCKFTMSSSSNSHPTNKNASPNLSNKKWPKPPS